MELQRSIEKHKNHKNRKHQFSKTKQLNQTTNNKEQSVHIRHPTQLSYYSETPIPQNEKTQKVQNYLEFFNN